MSQVSLNDFYRTGLQDASNVFDSTEFDLKQIADSADLEGAARAVVRALLDASDVSQIEAMAVEEGLDTERAVLRWKEGWSERAVPLLIRAATEAHAPEES